MTIAVNYVYKQYQQSRDMMPDEVYYKLFQSAINSIEIEQNTKDQVVQSIVNFAIQQIQSANINSLRFKTLVDPF